MIADQKKSETGFKKAITAFYQDSRGSISIEMLIVIPLLLFLTISGLAYWNAFHSNSRVAKVAYTLSDIMTRHDAVDATDMALLRTVNDKMLPWNVSNRRLRISSICFEDDQFRILWSYSASSPGTVAHPPLVVEDIPAGIMPIMAPQDSVILTELEGDWTSQFLNVGLGTYTWRSELVARPRFVKIIPHAELNPSNICPLSD